MLVKYLVDFPWVDIVPAGNNHVFFAVNDGEIIILILHSNVPGKQPAVFHLVGGFLRVVIVSFHNQRTADDQFTQLPFGDILHTAFDIDDSDIRIRKRDTDTAGFAHSQQRIGNAE